MKKLDSQKIRLGFFVIVGTIIFIIGVYLIGQRQDMFNSTYTLSSYFQNVIGLQKGNNVRYSGIDIGTVKGIMMVNDSSIRVDMSIDESIISHIKKDAIATIGSDGLVGNMIVNIVPGKGVGIPISDGDVIESYSKIGAEDILSTLGSSSESIALLAADLLKITNSMIEGRGTVGILLNDTLVAKDLSQSISNFRNASSSVTTTVNQFNDILREIKSNDATVLGTLINDTLSGQKIKNILSSLEKSSNEMDLLIKSSNQFINNVNSNEGTINYFLNDTSLVNRLKSSIKNIDEGTKKFNQNMEALKHNFLTRGYFRKIERQAKKKKE